MVYGSDGVELVEKFSGDFRTIWVVCVASKIVRFCNGKKSASEESRVPKYSSNSCFLYKVISLRNDIGKVREILLFRLKN